MARSITFTISGPVDTLIKIEELPDGTLSFAVEVLGTGDLGDLRGLFFDFADLDADATEFSVTGIDGSEGIIGKTAFAEESVDRVHKDVNVKGHVIAEQGKFDAGIEFGTPG